MSETRGEAAFFMLLFIFTCSGICNQIEFKLKRSFFFQVFECVVNWVNHDASNRKDLLPKLMEHVRLPFTTADYIIQKVMKEPLIKESPECMLLNKFK